jgi:uroporphyrinogen decarboxylase
VSYQRALKTARREPVDRVALFENLDHPAFMRQLLGWDPWDDPVRAYRDSYRALDVDWVVGVPRRSVRFAPGETSRCQEDALFTEWGLSGSYWRRDYRFHDEERVLAYDPLENRERDPLVTPQYNRNVLDVLRSDQELMGDSALVTEVYYTTLFQFGIMIFDWELYLTTASAHPERFQRVLEGFAEVSRRNLAEWARAGMEMVFIHDDIATERGLVFSPEWYRRRLFPLYERLLEPVVRRPGAPTVFVSDGNYTDVIDDWPHWGSMGSS